MHAAELLCQLREAGLPVASAWFSYEAAVHRLIVLFPAGQRPVKGSSENGWPAHNQQRALSRWNTYGYR